MGYLYADHPSLFVGIAEYGLIHARAAHRCIIATAVLVSTYIQVLHAHTTRGHRKRLRLSRCVEARRVTMLHRGSHQKKSIVTPEAHARRLDEIDDGTGRQIRTYVRSDAPGTNIRTRKKNGTGKNYLQNVGERYKTRRGKCYAQKY